MTTQALVWLKRDLRAQDHAPLEAAATCDAALALYVIEPEWLMSSECDAQHVAFALQSVTELRERLARCGLALLVRVGQITQVFDELRHEFGFTHLFSHEETGPGWTYERDKQVAAWCRERSIMWQEYPQTGVVRKLKTRSGWAKRWEARMNAPQVAEPLAYRCTKAFEPGRIPSLQQLGIAANTKFSQAAGQNAAWETLNTFLSLRGSDYRKSLSSPLSAEEGCSRLSPHLAFGTLSMRLVHQTTQTRIVTLQHSTQPEARRFAYALRGFEGRLCWHCHFMQKLEDEPQIEFRNFARTYDGLREGEFNREHFVAWCKGLTGYPMVDACMRSLIATGWLNFRMRAMLVSFAAYHLWLHWREPGLFLARQFLDFEPGIHWSQMQMQSGTTGINTLRVYSPTKQATDHDPQGIFIRRWVPELASVPLPYIAEPWTMPLEVQRLYSCRIGSDYPCPIVDAKNAVKLSKEKLYALRVTSTARDEADTVQNKHGSRKSGLPSSTTRKTKVDKPALSEKSQQGNLFE
jgi:deoxyribodipyrimidine photo-lyase